MVYLDRAARELRDTLSHRQIALLTHALTHQGEPYRMEGHQRQP